MRTFLEEIVEQEGLKFDVLLICPRDITKEDALKTSLKCFPN